MALRSRGGDDLRLPTPKPSRHGLRGPKASRPATDDFSPLRRPSSCSPGAYNTSPSTYTFSSTTRRHELSDQHHPPPLHTPPPPVGPPLIDDLQGQKALRPATDDFPTFYLPFFSTLPNAWGWPARSEGYSSKASHKPPFRVRPYQR